MEKYLTSSKYVLLEFCANESDSLSSEAKKIYLHLSSEFPAATHGKLFLSLRHESAELEMSIEDITSDACTRAMQKFSIAAKLVRDHICCFLIDI